MNKTKMAMQAGPADAMRLLEEELERLGYVGVPDKIAGPKPYYRRAVTAQGRAYLNRNDIVVTLSWPPQT